MLQKLDADIALARRKRQLTTVMMAERVGVAKSTYLKIEKSDPTVATGAYARSKAPSLAGGTPAERLA